MDLIIIVHHLILIILKNDFLILGEGDAFGIDGSFGAPEKKINITFSKTKTKFCLILHYNSDNLFVNGKEIYKFKATDKNDNSRSQFCLGSISNKFENVDSKKVSFKGNVYDFSVDYDAIDQSNISNICKYLMIKKVYKMFGII